MAVHTTIRPVLLNGLLGRQPGPHHIQPSAQQGPSAGWYQGSVQRQRDLFQLSINIESATLPHSSHADHHISELSYLFHWPIS